MERVALKAKPREAGKGIARRLRVAGEIPTVLYGPHITPIHLSINAREFEQLEKIAPDLTAIIDLEIEGKEKQLAMVRDHQADVFKRNLTHLDLQAIDLNEKIDIEVPIKLLGIPVGVKDDSGVLDQLRRRVHIRVLPTDIPSHLDVDVSGLRIGESIHADEVQLPKGVEFPHATNYTIATVVAPTKEEVVAAPVEVAEGAEAGATSADTAPAAGKDEKAAGEKKE